MPFQLRNKFFFDSFIQLTKNECWNWIGSKNTKGYGRYYINGKYYAAHRLSYALNTGNDPGKLLICHKCDNPSCVNPNHLFLGTQSDNVKDCVNKGRHIPYIGIGIKNPNAKLTEEQVRHIHTYKGYIPSNKVANLFNVSSSLIRHIWSGKQWKHIYEDVHNNIDNSKSLP